MKLKTLLEKKVKEASKIKKEDDCVELEVFHIGSRLYIKNPKFLEEKDGTIFGYNEEDSIICNIKNYSEVKIMIRDKYRKGYSIENYKKEVLRIE